MGWWGWGRAGRVGRGRALCGLGRGWKASWWAWRPVGSVRSQRRQRHLKLHRGTRHSGPQTRNMSATRHSMRRPRGRGAPCGLALALLVAAAVSGIEDPKPSTGCPRANGYFRHSDPQVCDKFVSCIDGEPNELPCPPGLIYDDTRSNCVWPTESVRNDCFNGKKDVLEDGFSCPDGEVMGPNGRPLPHPTFAHPDDCQKFYICRNGRMPQKGNCPDGTVYTEASFRCDDPENVPGCEKWFDDDGKRNKRK